MTAMTLDRLHRPRWLQRFVAFVCGYFWTPCPVCGRSFGGQEWGGSIWPTDENGHVTTGKAVCSQGCERRYSA